jgi:hypothetical protein
MKYGNNLNVISSTNISVFNIKRKKHRILLSIHKYQQDWPSTERNFKLNLKVDKQTKSLSDSTESFEETKKKGINFRQ